MRLIFKLLSAAAVSAALAAAPAAACAADAAGDVTLVAQQIVLEVTPVALPMMEESADAEPSSANADVDDAILAEINFARAHPQDYARRLLLQPVSDWERGLADPTDPAALAEAIEFLERQSPLPPLRPDDNLAAAALEHVETQGPAGRVGHSGPDGEAFDTRLRRHGVEARMWGENIAYGPRRPDDVVRELIIDSGVPDRGHRRNIFYATFAAAGVRCGPHRDYGAMCVMDFASPAPQARPEPKPWTQAALEPTAPPPLSLLHRLLSWW